ncbi:MAG: phosphoribosylanthranilate isomerase [Pikeienuella sp.]
MRVKICGLKSHGMVQAAAEAGAAYMGFVFFPKSPRNISVDLARELTLAMPAGVVKVALVVNPDDALLETIAGLPIDMLQLHGKETPERVLEAKALTGLPVMKAVGVADAGDLDVVRTYEQVADQILVDAKPPKDSVLPGGNGLRFDWRLLQGREWAKPWMLAGGLTPENAAEAVALTGATQLDVSSGVETSPGVKDAGLIRAFVKAAG